MTSRSGDTPPIERKFWIPDAVPVMNVLGTGDAVLDALERETQGVDIHVRGQEVTLRGEAQAALRGERLFKALIDVAAAGQMLTADIVRRAAVVLGAPAAADGTKSAPADVLNQSIVSSRGRTVRPKTLNQKKYVDAIDENTVVFGIGPAGTGKTYLAVAKGVQALQSRRVNRIVLTRPAVEAGERLGFLPGTLNEKIDPYLRPLHDALHDMLDPDSVPKLLANGTIEVAPLAYMRGRTLNDAFIILDEAQNTTPEQMKMFLTRLGFNSTMVITGDVTQVDLPSGTRSGLRVVSEVLDEVDDIAFCRLDATDVVRHRLVSEIVAAYDRWDETQDYSPYEGQQRRFGSQGGKGSGQARDYRNRKGRDTRDDRGGPQGRAGRSGGEAGSPATAGVQTAAATPVAVPAVAAVETTVGDNA